MKRGSRTIAEQLADFLNTKPLPQPYIVGRGILPVGGKCIIAGSPKSNKSWIILSLLLDLAMGRNAFEAYYRGGAPVLPITKPWRVLLTEQEMGAQGLLERLAGKDGHPGLCTGMENLEDLGFYIKSRDTAMRLDTPEGRDFINAEIASVKPDVVVFDPFAQFHLSDENSAQETSALMRVFNHIIEDFGCAVIVVHHTAKETKDDPRRGGNRLRGSSAIFGDIDTFIEVTRKSSEHSREPVLGLSFELRRGEPIEEVFVERLADGRVRYLGDGYVFGGALAQKEHMPKPKYRSL